MTDAGEVARLQHGWKRDARRAKTAMGALRDLLAAHGVTGLGCANAVELAREADDVIQRLTSDWLEGSEPAAGR